MTAQLELDLASPGALAPARVGVRRRAVALLRALLAWTPVWVPLFFLAQLVLFGFLPARVEEDRLDAAEAEVRARVEALQHEERELEREARMLADGVFQERLRRSLVDPKTEPLTLERARAAERR
jgi:hypothetical protein